MRFGATHAALLGVLGLALAVAGVPELLTSSAPAAPLHGVVVDSSGYALAGARVFLFAEEEARLCAETRSDASGEFSFSLVPARPRVFVRAPQGSGRLDAFGPPAEDAGGRLAFVLQSARPLTVHVRDRSGAAVAAAEVRLYEERGESTTLVALRSTDARGEAHLGAPARTHVAVVAPGSGLFRWEFACEVPAEGGRLEFELGPSTPLRGRVHSGGVGLAGIELVLAQDDPAQGWSGHAQSDATGAFELPREGSSGMLRALDPSGHFLPARLALLGEGPAFVELELVPGARQTVRTTQRGLPLVTRVYAWSPEDGLWGYGQRTNGAGRVELAVSTRFGLHAAPLDPAYEPIERWDEPWSAHDLRLEPERSP